MTHGDDLLERLTRANPVPDTSRVYADPDESRRFSLLVEHRRNQMRQMDDNQVRPTKVPQEPPRSNRGVLVAIAAFVVVLGVGISIVLLTGGDEGSDVAAPATTLAATTEQGSAALASAESLHTSFNQADFEGYRAVFAPDSSVDEENYAWGFVEELHHGPLPAVAPKPFGLQLEGECTEDNPALVRCTWVQRGGVFERAGIEVVGESVLNTDEEGAIIRQDVTLASGQNAVGTFFVAFGSWLKDAHPDVFEATYNTVLPEPVSNDAVDTLESRAQWAAVLDEFLAQSDVYPLDG